MKLLAAVGSDRHRLTCEVSMDERPCSQCGRPLPDTPYNYKWCPVCRSFYGIEERSDLAGNKGFPLKGRDDFTERLRNGFEMTDDDDPEDSWPLNSRRKADWLSRWESGDSPRV